MKLKFNFVKIKGPVGLTEPSGVTFIPNNRYLAVQDEIERSAPFYRLTWVKDRLVAEKLKTALPTIVDDLEGVFYDDPFLYAITSYSSSNHNRKRLIRFRLPELSIAAQNVPGMFTQSVPPRRPILPGSNLTF